jgi:signal transduction histidine kinase
MDQNSSSRLSPPIRFGLAIAMIVAASLLVFYLLMSPPMNDLWLMAVFLSITAVISALVSYTAYRLGWMHRAPSIRRTLLIGSLLSSLLIFLNVWLTARLMFASQHDLLLATVLLIFASGIAVAMGFFFAGALTDRIKTLDMAAHSIASGDLDTRIDVQGHDEIAELARTFNQMAAQLQEAALRQQEAENMRRDLVAWVGHDLQTPLASMRAILEALADGVVDDPQTVQRYLKIAQRDIGALSLLIDDLFQMAQLDAGSLSLDLANNSLSDLISDTLESFTQLASQKEVTLKGSVAPGVDPIWMDAPRIGRAINNLVSNALRHTPAGGWVEIRASLCAQGVCVEVKDNGEGIPPEDIPYVFDRFYRGEKSRNRALGGAGLGLAIAQGIIEAHGGQISVESIPDEFTRFTFNLPKRG